MRVKRFFRQIGGGPGRIFERSDLSQSGSVIFWILVTVALLGALTFAFTSSSRNSGGLIAGESTKARANQILQYGSDVRAAVKRLRLRGVAETDVSFQNTFDVWYVNGNCSSGNCKIFSSSGGGLVWQLPPPGVNDGTDWLFTTNQVPDVGTAAGSELMMILRNLTLEICNEINEIAGFGPAGGPPPQESDTIDLTKFTGTYGSTLMDDGANFSGEEKGCFEGNTTPAAGTYNFYQVLLGR